MLTARTVLPLVLLLSLSLCSRAGPYSPSECCFGYTKRPVRLDNLLFSYSTPRECYYPAIVFETKKGIKICADPEDKWVKRAVTELLKRKGLRAP